MLTGGGEGQNSGLSATQGLLWRGGFAQNSLQATSSSPVKSLFVERSDPVMAAAGSFGFVRSQQSTTPVLVQAAAEGHAPPLVAARMQRVPASGYDAGRGDEQHQQSASLSVISQLPGEYILPHTQLELGHSMAQADYPYADPYFGGMVTVYGAQAMIYPHMLGVQHGRMPLPSEITEEEPVYVNAKQYHGILRRRQSRAKAESENKLVKTRKLYLHESRHLHAMRRARGCGGRFLNMKDKDESKSKADGNVSSEGQLSQEGTACESHEMDLRPSLAEYQNQNCQTIQGISSHLMAGMGQSVVDGAEYHFAMLTNDGHSVISSSTNEAGYKSQSHQRFHSSVFHPHLSAGNKVDSGQNGSIMSNGSQQRAVAT